MWELEEFEGKKKKEENKEKNGNLKSHRMGRVVYMGISVCYIQEIKWRGKTRNSDPGQVKIPFPTQIPNIKKK